jgi:NitT/TauT family transport system permease protein
MKRFKLKFPVSLVFVAMLLLIWEGAVRVFDLPAYLLPAPSTILGDLDSDLLHNFLVTLIEAVVGFTIAGVIAFTTALLFVRSPLAERALFPVAITLKTTPLVAIAPLLVLWLGTGWWSKIVAAVLISFFPVLVNSVRGLKAADAEYYELFQSLNASRFQEFQKLRIPFCIPYLFAALKISSSLAIVGAIVGEFVGATQGLGYVILVSSSHLDTDKVFAAIFAAAFSGIGLFQVIGWIERRTVFWQRIEES